MATQRYISTKFWTDKWIRSLDPAERYLYLYLLTNTETTIAGIYQITIDRIAFDTGYDERTLAPMLERFRKAGKAFFYNGEWIIIPTWTKHQHINATNNCRKGIDAILKSVPDDVFEFILKIKYNYIYLKEIARPLQEATKGLVSTSNYLDSDLDLDSDLNLDLKTGRVGQALLPATPSKEPDSIFPDEDEELDSGLELGPPPKKHEPPAPQEKKDGSTQDAHKILDYLNSESGKHFRYTPANVQPIKARLKEGFTFDDFRLVIDYKTYTWGKDPKMSEYVRPLTLFGTKFESYREEIK